MWSPFKSERDAFLTALAVAALAGLAVLLGTLVTPPAGYAVFGGGVIAAILLALATRRREPWALLREAAQVPHPTQRHPAHRILVVANEALTGDELRRELLQRVELWPELLVVAPALCSRAHYLADDLDAELAAARRRLDATIAWAAERGFAASGFVGDPNPLLAIEDALRRFGPDEVIIVTHPADGASRLESGVVERVSAELDVPVTQVVVDLGAGHAEITPPSVRAPA